MSVPHDLLNRQTNISAASARSRFAGVNAAAVMVTPSWTNLGMQLPIYTVYLSEKILLHKTQHCFSLVTIAVIQALPALSCCKCIRVDRCL